jgi:hypothetical protein
MNSDNMRKYAEEWERVCLSIGPADMEKIVPIVNGWYRDANEAPPIIVNCQSPFQALAIYRVLRGIVKEISEIKLDEDWGEQLSNIAIRVLSFQKTLRSDRLKNKHKLYRAAWWETEKDAEKMALATDIFKVPDIASSVIEEIANVITDMMDRRDEEPPDLGKLFDTARLFLPSDIPIDIIRASELLDIPAVKEYIYENGNGIDGIVSAMRQSTYEPGFTTPITWGGVDSIWVAEYLYFQDAEGVDFSKYDYAAPFSLIKSVVELEDEGLEIPVEVRRVNAQQILNEHEIIARNSGAIFAFRGWCFVCDRPEWYHLSVAGKLSSRVGPAIEFSDGEGVYMWDGIAVPPRIITNPESITVDDVLMERNAELSRAMFEIMGMERFFEQAQDDMKFLASDEVKGSKRNLWAYESGRFETMYFVQVQDWSTDREYFIGVDEEYIYDKYCQYSCHAAIASTFRDPNTGLPLSPEQYPSGDGLIET